MRHIRKTLALFLALCFLAVVPLTVLAADDYNTAPIGNWKVYLAFDFVKESADPVDPEYAYCQINADGTCTIMIGGRTSSGTWSFSEDDPDFGYEYKWYINGNPNTRYFYYITVEGYFNGSLIIKDGNIGYLFSK